MKLSLEARLLRLEKLLYKQLHCKKYYEEVSVNDMECKQLVELIKDGLSKKSVNISIKYSNKKAENGYVNIMIFRNEEYVISYNVIARSYNVFDITKDGKTVDKEKSLNEAAKCIVDDFTKNHNESLVRRFYKRKFESDGYNMDWEADLTSWFDQYCDSFEDKDELEIELEIAADEDSNVNMFERAAFDLEINYGWPEEIIEERRSEIMHKLADLAKEKLSGTVDTKYSINNSDWIYHYNDNNE